MPSAEPVSEVKMHLLLVIRKLGSKKHLFTGTVITSLEYQGL